MHDTRLCIDGTIAINLLSRIVLVMSLAICIRDLYLDVSVLNLL